MTTIVSQSHLPGMTLAPLSSLPSPFGSLVADGSMFLALKGARFGPITGPALTGHPGDFPVVGFSVSVQTAIHGAVGGSLTVSIPVTARSAELLAAAVQGESFVSAELFVIGHSLQLPSYDAMTWSLGGGTITADGTSGDLTHGPVETLTLHFTSLTETVVPNQGTTGKLLPSITTTWDLTTNRATGTPGSFGGQSIVHTAPISLDFGSGQTTVESFSTSVTQPVALAKSGSVHAAGPLSIGDVTVVVPIDSSATSIGTQPGILAALVNGTPLAKVVLTVTNPKPKEPTETLILNNARIVSEQVSMGPGRQKEATIVLRPETLTQVDYYDLANARMTETATVGL